MSEEWAIALLSFALTVMTTVLGWVATEIRLLHKALSQYVHREDCASDMSAHCDRLEKLEDKVSENSEKLAAIEQYHTMIDVPILKKKKKRRNAPERKTLWKPNFSPCFCRFWQSPCSC